MLIYCPHINLLLPALFSISGLMQPINLVAQLILRTACEVGMDTNWDPSSPAVRNPCFIRGGSLSSYRQTGNGIIINQQWQCYKSANNVASSQLSCIFIVQEFYLDFNSLPQNINIGRRRRHFQAKCFSTSGWFSESLAKFQIVAPFTREYMDPPLVEGVSFDSVTH